MVYDYIAFTDGSSKLQRNSDTKYDSGSGTIVLDTKKNRKIKKAFPLPNKSNNYAELYAIYLALKTIDSLRCRSDKKINVLIVSDSKYSIDALSKWVYKWETYTQETWCNSSGKPIINQKLIKSILYEYLTDLDLNIHFLHINSHISKCDKKEIERIKNKISKQGFNINDSIINTLIDLNKEVDKISNDCRKELSA